MSDSPTKEAAPPKPERPSFETIYMEFANRLSERSTCRRLHVGCVITSPDHRRVYAIGYNGNVAGGRNDCDLHGEEAVGKCGCLHAEENAVINCDTSRHHPKIVYCTHMPCLMCAKRLINLGGVERVIYETPYRIHDSVDLLQTQRIDVFRLHKGRRHKLPTELDIRFDRGSDGYTRRRRDQLLGLAPMPEEGYV